MRLPKFAEASVLGVVALCLCAFASACTSTTGGTANPADTSSSPASSGEPSPTADAPKVTTPLDATKYVGDPCGLVPADVLTQLRYTEPGEPRPGDATPEGQSGPSCGWKIRGDGLSVLVILGTGNRDQGAGGLAGIQAAHDRSGALIKFLEPAAEVDGYPALYFDTRDRRAAGNCTMAVGIADDLAVSVFAEGYEGQQDSCDAAQRVAAGTVKTLKGA
ncbi:DUF3558 domain-containing protein [Amycolatopsis sp. NBC_01286]|uniref:DUF3558 domain-containing protein n=1 Tax=Amycolatopsis sp. NBC_01286 TaxID=2903560 RepID=UPI002E14949F|nr:DUF3558 domain-containing protein [Amycolatopsis sp. NBC_01286]